MVATTRAEAIKAVEAIFERYVGIFSGCYASRLLPFMFLFLGFSNKSEVSII
jgi:hypothetical protein